MLLFRPGAQRASRRSIPVVFVVALAAAFAVGGLATQPTNTEAAGKKVVIIVGPSGSSTPKYIDRAKALAAQARSYGAAVYEIYSPNATWSRVKSVAQGAKILIYLGHGNGWPSPYGSWQPFTKDGLGLNATSGAGNYNVKYVGEYYVDHYLSLGRNAVVILNHLCYASGNSEPQNPNPTRSVAVKRVDNYGAGFLRTNAKVVFAEGLGSAGYVLRGLFTSNRTMSQIFWSAPNATRSYALSFSSARTTWAHAAMDPYYPGRYFRSVIGALGLTANQWRTT